jgi:rRNA maturation endonuclease Nob1
MAWSEMPWNFLKLCYKRFTASLIQPMQACMRSVYFCIKNTRNTLKLSETVIETIILALELETKVEHAAENRSKETLATIGGGRFASRCC